jgi:alpha-galactosidase
VLDFSREEVVEHIYQKMAAILHDAKISYVKWDMNRSITECYSSALPADRQGEVFHRYILGVYALYERLTSEFPEILFESCAGGGGRFDPGLLYYAPQGWTSDDTDSVERLKIQYGTSFCYPLSSMGSHVSAVPNHQVNRKTPLETRANVAYFGTYGYELDLNRLTEEEQEEVKEHTAFMKQYRHLFQFGTFYRLRSPFESNETAWMVVSEDRKEAIVGWYRVLNEVNVGYDRVKLAGLDPDFCYEIEGDKETYYGDELMHAGLITSDASSGTITATEQGRDFDSRLYILKAR